MVKFILILQMLFLLSSCSTKPQVGDCFQFGYSIAKITKVEKYGVEFTTEYGGYHMTFYRTFSEYEGHERADCQ